MGGVHSAVQRKRKEEHKEVEGYTLSPAVVLWRLAALNGSGIKTFLM